MAQVVLADVLKHYDTLENVTLTGYRNPPALNHVSLTVRDGETLSVVGPSGCGKSTLLKVVAGLEYPNSGKVYFDDVDMTDIKPQDRGVGMVFQDYALYPSMKGRGNLQYFFEVHQRTQEEMDTKVRATAELMGMGFELLLGRIPDTLSGGEKQRVAIARCIVRDPTVFLMDEPISNLDAKLRERTRTEIKKLLQKFNITTLYVTHDQQEAIFMSDRIAVMRQGVIEQVGTFDEVYFNPANLFVATFIGTPPISIVPATLSDGAVIIGAARLPMPEWMHAASLPREVRLGVRPEGWIISQNDGAGVPVNVSHVERLPTERAAFVSGTLANTTVRALAPLDYPQVEKVWLMPDWERAYVFDAMTEAALHVPGVPELF
ncbi:MAG: ABC transporter ATP-binding protein [Anaerolineae bacterium]|nr:ABC transporter ATP-binding protein [Anaerolineae bacterium]